MKVVISKDKQENSSYHKPGCKWVDNIKPENRVAVDKTEAESRGYAPCLDCKP